MRRIQSESNGADFAKYRHEGGGGGGGGEKEEDFCFTNVY